MNFSKNLKTYKYHLILLLRLINNKNPLPIANSKEMKKLCDGLFDTLSNPTLFHTNLQKAISIIEQNIQINSYSDPSRSKEFTEQIVKAALGNSKNIHEYHKDSEIEIGQVLDCRVRGFNNSFIFVDILDYKEQGQIHISQIQDNFVSNIKDVVSIGEEILAKVLKKYNHPTLNIPRYYLSMKQVKK